MQRTNLFIISLCGLLLTACSSVPTKEAPKNRNDGRYSMKQDKAPDNPPDLSQLEDAVPIYEPYSRQGNKDYEVLGKNYQVLQSGKGVIEEGVASYYAAKFHGHLTSNGEVFDMYAMSGAHKTLPLPSYVRVTNLNNNKSAIIRINDRGPFHSTRILDMSYAAAYKLGITQTGTAPIRLEVIMVDAPEKRALEQLNQTPQFYIQVFASSSQQRAKELATTLEQKFSLKSRINQSDNVYRLQLGPISNQDIASKMLDHVRDNGYPKGFLIRD
ncbi:septal ring lytic transglycosylase RlpA family protein [Shewanella avicenniae]|uniref:Endolytic peptidoglycan transglycosylase RlpA n=1 Tax=Shewanella avicenniae TaxID=2814294 RepID=A0ABX7QU92_9GAMM|nr:septal ring lytic transglycosylase RlpA family protein [Shewanella avicenniae]QSX34597.1 septal ring lytic transglycosylase RlpA family protein [Shewanella avicenniae]